MEEKKYKRGNKRRLRLCVKRPKCNLLSKSKVWRTPAPKHIEQQIHNLQEEYNVSECSTHSSTFKLNIETENRPEIDETESSELHGRRIVDISHLFESIKNIKHTPFDCNFSHLIFKKEFRYGNLSKFIFKCSLCNQNEVITSEEPSYKVDINKTLVEAIICTGNGFSQLDEVCATINMPCMSNATFYKIEKELQNTFKDCALEEMLAAGEEEKRLAILNKEVDSDGYPLVPVVADGSWPKRSFKSGYSSLSGCACIIGYRTKKVLFLGIRNTYCCICSRAKNKGLAIPEHVCFKNWSNSATSMEEDIVVEGFQRSIEMHGVKYNVLIGDGDSSIINKLLINMPYGPNLLVKKVECKNHLLRNFCSKLKQLGKKTNNHKGYVLVELRKKVESNVLRLRKAVVGTINYRKDEDVPNVDKINHLKDDIRNSAKHVFGNHERCNEYFCKHPVEPNIVPKLESTGLWVDIQKCTSVLVNNADSLILDVTNNTAEQFHSIIAKFIGGKRVNFTSRGSYQTRCFGAVTSWNSQAQIHYRLQKKMADCSPGKFTKSYTTKRNRNLKNYTKRKLNFTDPLQSNLKKRKRCEPDEYYGVLELEEDLPNDEYVEKRDNFLASLMKTKEEVEQLEKDTRGQSDNHLWLTERRKRLTASYFGKICKMRKTTSALSTIKNILYSNFKGNSATQYGKEHESEAVREFTKITSLNVSSCGFFVHFDDCYLGASPDGLIRDDSLIEVKCPYSASNMSPLQAIIEKKINFCKICDNQVVLKRNQDYFYQVQGQLQVTGRKYCYFIVWTPNGLVYEKIERDDQFWAQEMQPKLKSFYFDCLLPELIDPRVPRNKSIRERVCFYYKV